MDTIHENEDKEQARKPTKNACDKPNHSSPPPAPGARTSLISGADTGSHRAREPRACTRWNHYPPDHCDEGKMRKPPTATSGSLQRRSLSSEPTNRYYCVQVSASNVVPGSGASAYGEVNVARQTERHLDCPMTYLEMQRS